MIRRFSFSILLLCTAPAVHAQVPAAAELLEPWLQSQLEHGAEVAAVRFVEHAAYTVDGPFGRRHVEQEVFVTAPPRANRWERTYRSLTVNGRPVPPERWDDLRRRRHGVAGVPLERIMRAAHLRPRLFARLRPAGAVARGDLDGVPGWRLDLVPREETLPVERLTLWFDRNHRQLRYARAILRRERGDAPFVVETEYTRVDGLDVPHRRRIEGTFQVKRRMRTFTMLFEYEGLYDEYRVTR